MIIKEEIKCSQSHYRVIISISMPFLSLTITFWYTVFKLILCHCMAIHRQLAQLQSGTLEIIPDLQDTQLVQWPPFTAEETIPQKTSTHCPAFCSKLEDYQFFSVFPICSIALCMQASGVKVESFEMC